MEKEMSKIAIIILSGLLVLSIILGGKAVYDRFKYSDLNDSLNEELMSARVEIGKAKTEFGNAQDKIGELQKDLKKAINDNNELIVAYGKLKIKYDAVSGGSGSGTVEPGQPVEPGEKYKPGAWYAAVDEQKLLRLEGISIDYSDHRMSLSSKAWPGKDWSTYSTRTDYKLNLKFSGQLVQTMAPSGAVNHYLQLNELDDTGKVIGKLTVEEFSVIVSKPKWKSWFLWCPHLDVGVFLGLSTGLDFSGGASVGFTVGGYGLTKNDLSWKFVRLGADISGDTIGLSISPAQYNIAELLPLISNLFMGPYFSAMADGSKSFGLTLSVGL